MRTFVTVDAAEARVARAAEVAVRQADTAPPRTADVGGDVAHFRRVVACHRDRAAVDHCKIEQQSNFKHHHSIMCVFAQC